MYEAIVGGQLNLQHYARVDSAMGIEPKSLSETKELLYSLPRREDVDLF